MTTRLSALPLEQRDVPAQLALGDGWADPTNLTLSFAPDGTLIGQPPPGAVEVTTTTTSLFGTLGLSALNSLLKPLTGSLDDTLGGLTSGPDSRSNADAAFNGAWKREVLRAFQSWISASNLNIGLAGDSAAAFGSTGDFQGDRRFGDIRIGGTKLHPSALANAVIVSPDNGTWAGDVLFNTAANYSSYGYDLFTVALHESGHVFGLEHSGDPNSVMSEGYLGKRTGLSASDIEIIRSYYGGARQADAFDRLSANGVRALASLITASGDFTLTGDLTNSTDADWYSFRVPTGGKTLDVRLATAGLSLLTAKLAVVDANGNEVAGAVSTDPTTGMLRVRMTATAGTYYLKVTAGTTDFGVGRYRLSVSGLGGEMTDVTPGGSGGFVSVAVPPAEQPVLASGTLTRSASRNEFTYTMASSGLFSLDATATATASGCELIVEVYDQNGTKVMSFTQAANGGGGGKAAYLQAGKYTVRTTAVIPLLAWGAKVDFTLRGGIETDPMGTYKPASSSSPYPTSPPPTSPPPSGSTSSGSTTTTSNSSTTTTPYSY